MNETLVTADGSRLHLGQKLGGGGEGDVYSIQEDQSFVAKVFHPNRRHRETHDKLQAMVRRAPPGAHELVDGFPVLAWPRQILYDGPPSPRRFVGYTMRRVDVDRDFVPLYKILSAQRRNQIGGIRLSFDKLVLIGMRIVHVVRTLHRMGYAVGDLNDRNILVSRRLTPLFLDNDSFQVPRGFLGHYPCRVGDRLYWPPELLGADLSKDRPNRIASDRYALSVILFQLFLDGMRPYQARGRDVAGLETVEQKTRAGLFPWTNPRRGRLEPPPRAPDYHLLPAALRGLFEDAFVKGHSRPRARPSGDDWYRVLRGLYAKGFEQCARFPLHRFASTSGSCPWCLDPNDPFTPLGERRTGDARRHRQPPRRRRHAPWLLPLPGNNGYQDRLRREARVEQRWWSSPQPIQK